MITNLSPAQESQQEHVSRKKRNAYYSPPDFVSKGEWNKDQGKSITVKLSILGSLGECSKGSLSKEVGVLTTFAAWDQKAQWRKTAQQ